jgi:serine/threonine protein kinase
VTYQEGVGSGEKFSLVRLRQAIPIWWRSEKNDLLRLTKALNDSCEREKNLKKALEDSRTCVEELNIRRKNNAERKMGALAPFSHGPQEANVALASYDAWVKKHVSNELADKSDEAMKALSAALTNSATVDLVLGLPAHSRSLVKSLVKSLSHMAFKRGSITDNNLKQAFMSADEALDAKYEQLKSDALGEFPCTALVRAGRNLLETWQAETAAINGLLQAYRMLEDDIRLNDKCLVSSGKRSKDKDKAVRELCKAREKHKKALKNLNVLKPILEGDEKQTLMERFSFCALCIFISGKMPGNTNLVDLQRSVRESLKDITDATFKLSGKIQAHFPEVVLFIGQGLPPDLAALWRPPQSLDDGFDKKELVPTESRHHVWRVRQGGAEFAIKVYQVAQASDLRTCLKEAAIIYRQRHPAIVGIKALFQGSGENKNNFYVQMPWYQHGSLDKWVDSDQRPKWPKVRSVLLDALHGLAHLHDNGVIHSDVKPQNILVDSRERGCLADFDISIDTKARTCAAHLNANKTMRGTQDAWTAGFAAPELISSRHATRHTDIFAYGKTVHAVKSRCEPDNGADNHRNMERGQTAELISALTSRDPESRPPAKDAMQAPFFAVLKDVPTRVTQTCAFCKLNGNDAVYGADEGIQCSEGHFHCGSCLTRLTKHLIKVENQSQLAQREAQVMCFKFPRECRSPGFHAGDLARHLPVEDFQALLKARIDVMNQQKASELEDQFQQRVNEELKRLLALDDRGRKVLMHRKHIEEEILLSKCPRPDCRRAFYDFDGCFAVSCGSCPCKFCGWCLLDCGDDNAHPHVASCSEKPPNADPFFGSMQDFKDSHNKRCKRKITEYLESLDPQTCQAVKRELEQQLGELGIEGCVKDRRRLVVK